MNNILLTGGGTAGHVTPHLALLPYLRRHFDNVYFIGKGNDIEKSLLLPHDVPVYSVNAPALKRSLTLSNLSVPYRLVKSIKQAITLLTTLNCSVVFSKGGYCALPVCLAAAHLKIPVVCHESDLTPGLANRICAPFSRVMLTSFEQTAIKYGWTYSGPPLRDCLAGNSKAWARRSLSITGNKPVLLITGGSQGSQTINQAVFDNLTALTDKYNVIHLCGKGNKPAYKAINGYYPFEFADMKACLRASDICISRGGSNTLFELLQARIPSLIVPLVKGSRGDQIKNAQYFERLGCVLTADENVLSEQMLCLLQRLGERSQALIKNMDKLRLDGANQFICDVIVKASKVPL